jgi:hypothetical protein
MRPVRFNAVMGNAPWDRLSAEVLPIDGDACDEFPGQSRADQHFRPACEPI